MNEHEEGYSMPFAVAPQFLALPKPEEYRQIVNDAQHRGLLPTTVARMMLVEGLVIVRRKGTRARSMERSRKRGKGETA